MDKYALADMATFFLALADKTRLRILNLMRGDEVCVAYFTAVLRESQPKISRHLAYLRRSRIVETRRDGKWIYYRLSIPEDERVGEMVKDVLKSLGSIPQMKTEKLYLKELIRAEVTHSKYISDESDMLNFTTPARHNELEEFLL